MPLRCVHPESKRTLHTARWSSLVSSHVVVFDLDGARCAIDADAVIEIVRAAAVRPLPGQPAFIAGAVDLRGAIIPVLDLRVRLGFRSSAMALSDNFIIVNVRLRTVALWVGSVLALTPHRNDAVQPRGLLVGDRALAGVARMDEGLVVIHDVDQFLTQAEADALTAVTVQ